jgi:D-glycero-alpha-D-manno-heptose-7-phosphate kinase
MPTHPANRVRARAWCRVDLAGGTLDLWPLGLLHPGSRTVNLAIDLPVVVELTPADNGYRIRQGESEIGVATAGELAQTDGGALIGVIALEVGLSPSVIEIRSASPQGGGLGASSALTVATLAASDAVAGREPSSATQLARRARDLEARLMSLPTGIQDHFPALLGGALEIEHRPGGETVRRLEVDLDRLGDSLLVAYTGRSHFSAGNNWRIVRRRLEGDSEIVELFDGIRDVAQELPAALEKGDWQSVGELMAREWSFRSRLAEGISTPEIEWLLAVAGRQGAWGGKACGAGGGGCLAVLGPAVRREKIAQALEAEGARVLPARPVSGGLEVGRTTIRT